MKYVLTLAVTAAVAAYAYIQFGHEVLNPPQPIENFTGRVIDVIDGDSISVQRKNGIVRIELDGIDAPELSQPFGEVSAYFLSDFVKGREVRVAVHGTNEYGDEVAEVFLDSISVNRLMLTDGYAWAKRGRSEDPTWAGLESLARGKNLGLWRDGDPMSPWEYRELLAKS